jgi:cysteinyl-tRNA synthetase
VDAVPEAIAALARRRDEARGSKDWAAADALRAEIESAGYVVEDSADGTVVRPG